MKKQQFEQEIAYGAALAIAKALLSRRLITQDEHRRLQSELIHKYRPAASAAGSPKSKGAAPMDSAKEKGGP